MRDDSRFGAAHIALYMFPRQFGLHNVFTSFTDVRDTAQPFQDYTIREDEIRAWRIKEATTNGAALKIPRRLRGEAMLLIHKLQRLHRRCSYKELLDYYCSEHVSICITYASSL